MYVVEILRVYLSVQIPKPGIPWTVTAVLKQHSLDMEEPPRYDPNLQNAVAVGTLHIQIVQFLEKKDLNILGFACCCIDTTSAV